MTEITPLDKKGYKELTRLRKQYDEEDIKIAVQQLKERLNRANKEDVVYEFDEIISEIFGELST